MLFFFNHCVNWKSLNWKEVKGNKNFKYLLCSRLCTHWASMWPLVTQPVPLLSKRSSVYVYSYSFIFIFLVVSWLISQSAEVPGSLRRGRPYKCPTVFSCYSLSHWTCFNTQLTSPRTYFSVPTHNGKYSRIILPLLGCIVHFYLQYNMLRDSTLIYFYLTYFNEMRETSSAMLNRSLL